jgi:hypothetical protein
MINPISILKSFLRNIESIIDILVAIIYVNLRYNFNKYYRNSNDELIVLGNGPSLKAFLNNNLDQILSHDIICCNEFAQSDYFEVLKPKYYVFIDPAYWRDTTDIEFNENLLYTFNSIKDKTQWPMVIFMKSAGRKKNHFKDLPHLNSNIKIEYIYTNSVDANINLQHFLYKNNVAMPPLYNVLGVCIFLGINMGYKNIKILGADHSWHKDLIVKPDNILYLKNSHFYDKTEIEDKPFYVDSYMEETFRMHEILLALSFTFKGYHSIRAYSEYMNTNILNLTIDSSIDAFEKPSLFNKKQHET